MIYELSRDYERAWESIKKDELLTCHIQYSQDNEISRYYLADFYL